MIAGFFIDFRSAGPPRICGASKIHNSSAPFLSTSSNKWHFARFPLSAGRQAHSHLVQNFSMLVK